jgi:hypothetical protein
LHDDLEIALDIDRSGFAIRAVTEASRFVARKAQAA